jgi:hypothetical protein
MPEHAHPAASPTRRFAPVQLDAYPRLCGLPVTIERVATGSIAAPAVARPARASRRLVRTLTAFLFVAAVALAGASVARAQAPAPTTQTTARAAGHISAIIPPRLFPRVLPRPLRTPRAQQVAARINTSWGKVKTLAAEHSDDLYDAAEHLRDAIDLALDLYQDSQSQRCAPIIEPLCTLSPIAHDASRPAFGMILIGPYAGRAVAISCWWMSARGLVYYTPTLGKGFYAKYVWTPWYPRVVPILDRC